MNEGQEEREFRQFPEAQRRGEGRPLAVWKERPGDTGVSLKCGGMAAGALPRAWWHGQSRGAINTTKCGIKRKRRRIVLACLLASAFL